VPPFVAPDPSNAESGKTSPGIDASLEYLPLEQDRKGHKAEEARGGPVGLGFRVPMIVASPWSRGGYVCSQVFDHTSVLRFLERMASRWSGKDVREENITAWRRAVCGDLTAAFRRFDSRSPTLQFPPRDSFFEQVHQAQFTPEPSGYRKLSAARQEPGLRPSTALPYELAVSGKLNSEKAQFEIALEARDEIFGKTAAGAPFHVYTPGRFHGEEKLRTRAYAVEAGHVVTDSWALEGFQHGVYHLRVCGPNGFFREFQGSADDPPVDIRVDSVRRKGALTGDIQLWIANRGDRATSIQVKNYGYKGEDHTIAAARGHESSLTLTLGQSYHWYDFAVTVAGADRFLRRFAGRVETGEDGFSDPVMGG
jgi:phospholipase C